MTRPTTDAGRMHQSRSMSLQAIENVSFGDNYLEERIAFAAACVELYRADCIRAAGKS